MKHAIDQEGGQLCTTNRYRVSLSRTSFAIFFLRCAHVRHVKGLFTSIQKQQNMLKISLLFRKFTNFTGK